MEDGTDGRRWSRRSYRLIFATLLLQSTLTTASHVHLQLQDRMQLLSPFSAPPPPPPLLSPPLLGHLGPLLGSLPNTQSHQLSGFGSLNRHQGYPQHETHRHDPHVPDNQNVQDPLGYQRPLGPLGYSGPQPPPLPPTLPPPSAGGIRDYSQNQLPPQLSQLPQLPSHPSARPPYWTALLSYQRPLDAMVDITNELGIAVLQDYAYSRGNFAFSPYGVASILVVLFEAARGESARQVHSALKLPWDRAVVRVGFRDIHRSLRGYFNHEGFLSGVTMSQTRTALLPEFRQILRFYGYDVDLPPDGFNYTEPSEMQSPAAKPPAATDIQPLNTTQTPQEKLPSTPPPSTTTPTQTPQENKPPSTSDKPSLLATSPTQSPQDKPPSTSDKTSPSATTPPQSSSTDAVPTAITSSPIPSTEEPPKTTASSSSTSAASAQSEESATTPPQSPSTDAVTAPITSTASPIPSTEEPPKTEATPSSTSAASSQSEEPATTTSKPDTNLEAKMTTPQETSSDEPQTVASLLTPGDSKSQLISAPPDAAVFTGLLMGSKLQEQLNSLFPNENSVESRMNEVPIETLDKNGMSEPATVSTEEIPLGTGITSTASTGTETLESREDTTSRSDSVMNEVLEEIESTQPSSEEPSKVTTLGMETPKENENVLKMDGVTTEVTQEKVTESPKALPTEARSSAVSLTEDGLNPESRTGAISTTSGSTSSEPTTIESSTTELFVAATYIPPREDPPSAEQLNLVQETTVTPSKAEGVLSTVIDSESTSIRSPREAQGGETQESKKRRRRWARKKRAPKAEFKFRTGLDAGSANDTYRSRRGLDAGGVPDLSMQLQNGMFDSHVATGPELFTQLPRRPFWVDGVVEEMVPVMEYTAAFPYAYIPRLHAFALEFPLDDERYRLLLLLPAERGTASLGQLLRSLARGQAPLRGVMRSLRLTRLHAVVPAFMAEGFVILTPTLQQLGIWDLFDPRRADLSGMTATPNLYVRNIEQAVTVVVKSYVEILDIQTRTTAARARTESFVASHPFLYFVMDAETHVALMAGKVVDPLNSRIY